MFSLLTKGGPFMYVILITSLVGMVIIVERVKVLFFSYGINKDKLLRTVTSAVDGGNYQNAINHCNHNSNPLCQVLKAGLLKGNRADKEIERAMEEEVLRWAPRINKRIGYLSMLSNTATLLGLLGTIIGLISAFKGVGLADAAMKQQALASGISVAMFTTAFGLIVAIPLLVAYHKLQAKANSIIDSIQEGAVTLLNRLSTVNRDKFEKRKLSRIA